MTKPPGVHALIRRTHEERIICVLRDHGSLTRGEISRHVGLSRTTLSEITSVLLDRGAIVAQAATEERSGRGRPAERLALDPAAGQVMGVDFGHSRVHIAVADASHEVIASGSRHYDQNTSWPDRIRAAFDLAAELGKQTGTHYGALQNVGIGVPGPFSPRMPQPLASGVGSDHQGIGELVSDAFAAHFAAPIIIDNNARFAGLAEAIWGGSRAGWFIGSQFRSRMGDV
ncbi:ROK family protein [Leifsonia sp. A12D58]|uniref:ROK family protein n=1 Tax=Leifsonia sp. A12D58 TaxID=3397674 RepID=UPI0039E084F5